MLYSKCVGGCVWVCLVSHPVFQEEAVNKNKLMMG